MFKRHLKLGLIKGGQLGKMMLQAAPSFDVRSFVMDDNTDCPCRHLCYEFTQGDAMNFDDVYAFGKKVDVLTFEYEHIHVEALKKLKAEGLAIYPDPSVIELVQDKGRQKEFFRRHNIPTADFQIVPNRLALKACTDFFPAVQKTCKAGYDGKGIFKLKDEGDIPDAFNEPSVLEKLIDFDKEISIVLARNIDGEVAVYRAVEMVFHPEKNLVEYLRCPADISADIEKKATSIALRILHQLNLVGVLAVEIFVTKEKEVLVNEIAPRVHNSGHHTIEGALTSQFEQHLRAVMGLPLGLADMTMPSVMVNLLGAENHEGKALYQGIEKALSLEGVYIHLYGKAKTKPFRKMGHATVLDRDINKAMERAHRVKELIKIRA
jgi:5-(carboxyamino)imidazole ribonucleotide synthase